jgi:hypothetical protein
MHVIYSKEISGLTITLRINIYINVLVVSKRAAAVGQPDRDHTRPLHESRPQWEGGVRYAVC